MFRRLTDTRPSLIFQRNIWSLLSQAPGAHVTEYLMNSFSFRQSSSVCHKVSFYPPCLWKWELLVKLGSGDERTAEGRLQITSSDRHIGTGLLTNLLKTCKIVSKLIFQKLSSVSPASNSKRIQERFVSRRQKCQQSHHLEKCSVFTAKSGYILLTSVTCQKGVWNRWTAVRHVCAWSRCTRARVCIADTEHGDINLFARSHCGALILWTINPT